MSDAKTDWEKRLEEKVLDTALVVEMWACGECTPEYALRYIRRELAAVVAKMQAESGLSGPKRVL